MPDSFHCTVVTPEKQALDTDVKYVSVPAWDGQIGIAPQRAPLMLKLGDGALRLDLADNTSRYFFVSGGFAQMKENQLTLLTDSATEAKEIDRAKAEQMLKDATARKAAGDDEIDARLEEEQHARAMIETARHG